MDSSTASEGDGSNWAPVRGYRPRRPIFFLTDTDRNSAEAGSQQFFSNVLAGGTAVLVLDTSNLLPGPEIDAFYDGLAGVTSTLVSGALTKQPIWWASIHS